MSNTGKTMTARAAVQQQDQDQEHEVAEVHPCSVCPMRSIAQNETHGYCEGCTQATRRCRSCWENKPQTGWGWGFLWGGMAAFLCADCRIPAEPDVATTHPRFTRQLETEGQRYAVAEALSAGAASTNAGSGSPVAASVLSRLAECLRSGDGKSMVAVDVDLSDVPMQSRRVVLDRLSRIRDYARDPRDTRVLRTLVWAWAAFVEDSAPPPPGPAPTPTVAEVSRRVNGEIWI